MTGIYVPTIVALAILLIILFSFWRRMTHEAAFELASNLHRNAKPEPEDKRQKNLLFIFGGPHGFFPPFFGWALGPFTSRGSTHKSRDVGKNTRKVRKKTKRNGCSIFDTVMAMFDGTYTNK